MTYTVQEFQQRMRHDRAFRQRILAARKFGTLAETMAQEGCAFDLSLLEVHLPQVNTGIRAWAAAIAMVGKPVALRLSATWTTASSFRLHKERAASDNSPGLLAGTVSTVRPQRVASRTNVSLLATELVSAGQNRVPTRLIWGKWACSTSTSSR